MSDVWNALADKSRRTIIALLRERDMTAGEIAAHFDMAKPSVSHHLSILKNAGLVSCEKKGQNLIYSANMTVFQELIELVVAMADSSSDPLEANK
ncbi:autorepressor SdpR family transcription factor [Treponema brennaborense]|uniref:Regulatory protein ArsR n=1 Tax=Treponema brennaborense (strain DSM 12168 / CIP 105900 / DD5/3) TaxID=906968 RepID=F4LJS5_TREBD|nr:autorepressor SdpR family transcription factor [Treponema brennaborense]AEE17455.1 regulatory protein ArsR [Treponema brennaborense DSM 12168]